MSIRFQMPEQHLHGALHGALIGFHNLAGACAEFSAFLLVRQEFGECLFQLRSVTNLNHPMAFEEGSHFGAEVLHVGPEDSCLAQRTRLDGILPAFRGEALADEDDIGNFVEKYEFTGGIDDQAIELAGSKFRVRRDLRAPDEFQFAIAQVSLEKSLKKNRGAANLQFIRDGSRTLHVSGNQDQEKVWELFAEPEETFDEQRLLTVVGTAGNHDPRACRDAELAKHGRDIEVAVFPANWSVEFHVPRQLDRISLATHIPQPFEIRFVLSAHRDEPSEEAFEQESKVAISRIGSSRKPGVHKEHRNPPIRQLPQEVGPDFRFDKNDRFRMDRGDGAAHAAGKVDGVVYFFNMRWELFLKFAHASGSRGRDHELRQGQPLLQRMDQLRADIRFADAHRVDPNDVAIGEGVFERAGVTAEALPKPLLPIPAPPHLQEIEGRAKPKENEEKDLVKLAHRCPREFKGNPAVGARAVPWQSALRF